MRSSPHGHKRDGQDGVCLDSLGLDEQVQRIESYNYQPTDQELEAEALLWDWIDRE